MKTLLLAFTAAVAASLCSSPGYSAMLLRYTFDEPDLTGDALDSSLVLPQANGQLLGGATRTTNTPGPFSARALDLTNDNPYAHVLGPDADKLDGMSQITLTTWLNVSAYTSGNHRLASKQNAGTFGGFNFSMNATPNDGPVGPDNFRVGMFIGNNVSAGAADFGAAFSSADVDAASKWVLLAVTYDNSAAAGNTKFYIGGVNTPMAQLGADQTLPQLIIDGGPALFGIGYTDAAPTANTSVIGFQDDVRVYRTALSLAELEAVRLAIVPEPSAMILTLLASLCGWRRRR